MSPQHDIVAQLMKEFERSSHVRPLALAITQARDWRARLDAIKHYYAAVDHEIHSHSPSLWAFDPYEVDWPMLFTPIESALWSDIRALEVALYPQYPVTVHQVPGDPDSRPLTFFADFANPVVKVAIECDGKAFHTDPARDRRRDELMRRSGWQVYRFTGAQCREDFNGETMQRSTVARELERIARLHFGDEDLTRYPAAAPRQACNGFE